MAVPLSPSRLVAGLLLAALLAGCKDTTAPRRAEPIPIPSPSTPENLVKAIEVIYNDKLRTKDERVTAYDSLFAPTFRFFIQPVDQEHGLPESWGIATEIEAHEGMFKAQAEHRIYSLTLSVVHDPARPLYPPEVGREGWMEVFAASVNLRLLSNPNDGLEVNGAQGRFKMFQVPPPAGRWYIGEWVDLPRPEPLRPRGAAAVESSTWGSIKALFLRP